MEIAVAPDVSPITGAAVERSTVVPSPSCPNVLVPQHHADSSAEIAQT